jgi:hypothetical protein
VLVCVSWKEGSLSSRPGREAQFPDEFWTGDPKIVANDDADSAAEQAHTTAGVHRCSGPPLRAPFMIHLKKIYIHETMYVHFTFMKF